MSSKESEDEWKVIDGMVDKIEEVLESSPCPYHRAMVLAVLLRGQGNYFPRLETEMTDLADDLHDLYSPHFGCYEFLQGGGEP